MMADSAESAVICSFCHEPTTSRKHRIESFLQVDGLVACARCYNVYHVTKIEQEPQRKKARGRPPKKSKKRRHSSPPAATSAATNSDSEAGQAREDESLEAQHSSSDYDDDGRVAAPNVDTFLKPSIVTPVEVMGKLSSTPH